MQERDTESGPTTKDDYKIFLKETVLLPDVIWFAEHLDECHYRS